MWLQQQFSQTASNKKFDDNETKLNQPLCFVSPLDSAHENIWSRALKEYENWSSLILRFAIELRTGDYAWHLLNFLICISADKDVVDIGRCIPLNCRGQVGVCRLIRLSSQHLMFILRNLVHSEWGASHMSVIRSIGASEAIINSESSANATVKWRAFLHELAPGLPRDV